MRSFLHSITMPLRGAVTPFNSQFTAFHSLHGQSPNAFCTPRNARRRALFLALNAHLAPVPAKPGIGVVSPASASPWTDREDLTSWLYLPPHRIPQHPSRHFSQSVVA